VTRRKRAIPKIPESALRDYGQSDRLPVVWRRLRSDLSARAPSARRSPFAWAWAPALASVIFGSGVFVGARFVRPQALPSMQAEPPAAAPRPAGPAPAPSAAEPEITAPQEVKSARGHGHRATSSGAASAEPLVYAPSESSSYAPSVPAQAPEWQRLAEGGDFTSARRALDQLGGFDVAMAHASPSELMSLVDIARASGERGQAIRALRQVVSHPEAPEAPLAAWTLGNLLDQAGDQPGSAQAFALYRRLSPAGDFAEDAAARQIDAALGEGNVELATQLVEDYARDFPHGRRLGEFRRATAALVARGKDAGPSAKPENAQSENEDDTDDSQSGAPTSRGAPAASPEAH